MKIWIIVLSIVFILLRIVTTGIANYIMYDPLEKLKYKALDGASTLGVWYGFLWLLGTLVGFADVVLIIIAVVNLVL